MNYKEFMNDFISKRISGVYLFDSKEEFLNESIIDEAKRQVQIPDFNFIDIKELSDIEVIKNAYETYPVMEDRKIIIWRGVDLSRNNIKDYEEVTNGIIDDLSNFPDYALFLIFSDNPPFKGKFYKAIDKNGQIVKIDRLKRDELESFIGKRFLKNRKKIPKRLVADIVDRFSYLSRDSELDLYDIVNTVDKIISNSTDEIVTDADVNYQLDEILDLNIFNLTDALSQRNSKNAIRAYMSIASTEDDMFMIFHMIIRQFRNLIGIKTLNESGHNDKSMMDKLGIKPFELKKNKSFINYFSLEELFNIYDRLFDMEYRQKSSDFDMNLELLMLINQICK